MYHRFGIFFNNILSASVYLLLQEWTIGPKIDAHVIVYQNQCNQYWTHFLDEDSKSETTKVNIFSASLPARNLLDHVNHHTNDFDPEDSGEVSDWRVGGTVELPVLLTRREKLKWQGFYVKLRWYSVVLSKMYIFNSFWSCPSGRGLLWRVVHGWINPEGNLK